MLFNRRHLVFASLASLLAFAGFARAAEKDHLNLKDGVAAKGYDVVSHVDDGKAVPGKESLVAQYEGATYRFSSQEHLQKFKTDPGKFIPQFGGWCATAFAEDHGKVDVDPRSFKVTDGKLYLFYKGLFGDARKEWLKDEPGNVVKANQNWKKTVGG